MYDDRVINCIHQLNEMIKIMVVVCMLMIGLLLNESDDAYEHDDDITQ